MDRREGCWLCAVRERKRPEGPRVMLSDHPARLSWHQVRKVEHCQLLIRALTPTSSGGAHE